MLTYRYPSKMDRRMIPAETRRNAMLTPGEIYSNLDDLAADPPAGAEFGLALMEAVGAPRSTITKLRDNVKDGAFTWTRMLRFEATERGGADKTLDRIRAEVEAAPKGRRPRVLLAYDGERIAAYDTSPKFDEEPLRVGLDMLSLEGDVFFPLGGHERYVPKKERMADVRATRFISRFHDAVRDTNPGWTTDADRHAVNIFMARMLFCLFADDVGIFGKDAFEIAVRQSTSVDGADLAAFLEGSFRHMKTTREKRSLETKSWSKLPYVNGSLFDEDVLMPRLDGRCRKLLLDCAGLNWKLINPDIFGSMLQAVVDVEKRGELGMHYTSPVNIMKVLEPILLDSLQAELNRAGSNKSRLRIFLERLSRIRVFDPACGSGNFLILAYKEMRALEIEAMRRLALPRLSGIMLERPATGTGSRSANRLPAASKGGHDSKRQRSRNRLAGSLPAQRGCGDGRHREPAVQGGQATKQGAAGGYEGRVLWAREELGRPRLRGNLVL
jgi:hypothetical protein